jgi:COMPASS component SPP1
VTEPALDVLPPPATTTLRPLEPLPVPNSSHAPLLKQEDSVASEATGLPQWPSEGPVDADTVMKSVDTELDLDLLPPGHQDAAAKDKKSKTAKDADGDKDKAPKPTKHSSKNEGQHTDRRYLCYICNKLFTRRRSVRDHIAKIHSVKSWEPLRSLEVIVDPHSGEPLEPLEDVIARGPPPPPQRSSKVPKDTATDEAEDQTLAADDQVVQPALEQDIATENAPPSITSSKPTDSEPHVKRETETPAEAKATSLQNLPSPVPIIGKKRPAPEANKPLPAAMTKKGIARPKPANTPNKKPKLSESDSISEKGTPARSPSPRPAAASRAPASKLKKQVSIKKGGTPTPVSSRMASVEPASPSPSAADSPGSSNDDGEIFCICRKGDNHTWMIACDGGCDEWFHGNCVQIKERDGDLIDKYICPRCTKPGLQTTWKRMCRRKGCRKPARVFQDPPSKYCSKECGRMFFVEVIRRGDPYIDTIKNDQFVVDGGRPKKIRKKRKPADPSAKEKAPKAIPMVNGDVGELVNPDSRLATPAPSDDEKSEYETDTSADEDQLPNRAGPLRAGELKAIVNTCKTIEQWKELGRKPNTPPLEPDEKEVDLDYDDFDLKRLESLRLEKEQLDKRGALLDAREKMLNLVKARSTGITDELKKDAPKDKKGNPTKIDPCGFDTRLAWSEEAFLVWHDSRGGKEVLESGKIGPPSDDDQQFNVKDKKQVNGVTNGDHDSDDNDSEGKDMPKKGGVCVRIRCPRHKNWAKASLAEIRFEQEIVRRGVRKCEDSEKDIRERAIVRAWEQR